MSTQIQITFITCISEIYEVVLGYCNQQRNKFAWASTAMHCFEMTNTCSCNTSSTIHTRQSISDHKKVTMLASRSESWGHPGYMERIKPYPAQLNADTSGMNAELHRNPCYALWDDRQFDSWNNLNMTGVRLLELNSLDGWKMWPMHEPSLKSN